MPCSVLEAGSHRVDQDVLEFTTMTQTHEYWGLGCCINSLGSLILECGVYTTNCIHNFKQPCVYYLSRVCSLPHLETPINVVVV